MTAPYVSPDEVQLGPSTRRTCELPDLPFQAFFVGNHWTSEFMADFGALAPPKPAIRDF